MPRSHFTLTALLLAAACSNGSGGGAPATVSPTVVAQYPAPSSVAESTSEVRVTFAEALDPASITIDSVQVVDDLGPIEGTATYDSATQTIRWTSRFGLTLSASHEATLLGNVRDLAGTELGGDLQWQFRVRNGIWSAPEPLVVQGIQMERSGTTWLNMGGLGYLSGTPGNWTPQALPFEGDLVIGPDDTMTVVSHRLVPYGPPPTGGIFSLIIETATRRSTEQDWLTEQILNEMCRQATVWVTKTSFGDPVVNYFYWLDGWIHHYGLATRLHTDTGTAWHVGGSGGAPYESERIGPAGQTPYMNSTTGNGNYDEIFWGSGTAVTRIVLSPPIERGHILFLNWDPAGRMLFVQRETPSPGMNQITSRRIHPDGTVEAATVLHAHSEPQSAKIVTSNSGHTMSFIYAGAVSNEGSSYLVHRFDPDSGTWSSLPPLFTNSGNVNQPELGSIVADTRGTFWILSPERTATGIPVLIVNRLRPQDSQMSLMLSAEWYELKAFDVDDTGRAMMSVNAGLMSFR
tara:strand:- start:2909 stop:4462 length:1554 start_codon:yes stop_codon:yes gene_type:complete